MIAETSFGVKGKLGNIHPYTHRESVEKLIEIEPGKNIDQYLPNIYTKSALKKML